MHAGTAPAKLRLQAGGTLNPRRHLYVERPDDAILLKLLSEGQYVNVLTSRQMGKSSLMVRTAESLRERNVRCAIVDLAAELGTPENASAYFLGLLNKIARDLNVKVDLATSWTERPEETLNQRLMRFFREVVLEQLPGPVVCFLDEIDSTLKLPWTDDLFTALRGMHNERPLVPAYERLTFCLIGVAWPNELIKDRRTTPYNIGSTLELRDFDLGRDDLTPLAAALSADSEQGRRLIERVLYWTGGHPYITLRLCATLVGAKTPKNVDQLVRGSFQSVEHVSEDVHFQQILRFIEARLTDSESALHLYERILSGVEEKDQQSLTHAELKLSGLVKRDAAGRLRVRNRIYVRLFNREWLAGTDPIRRAEQDRRSLTIRKRLTSLKITVTSAQNREGTRISLPEDASQSIFEEIAPLLKSVGLITELDLTDTQIANLDPLTNLTDLQVLDTSLADLTPLASLTNLQKLGLVGTSRVDLTPLASLANLQELMLDTPPADLIPLAKVANLQELTLVGGAAADLTPLANLTNLQRLILINTPAADLTPLANLTNLQRLILINTPAADLTPLADLTNLKMLFLLYTSAADLTPLSHLTNLHELILGATSVFDLTPLANLINLKRLDFSRTPIADLTPLANLANLQWLYVPGTQVTDLSPLTNLTKLQELDIRGTRVSPVSITELRLALAEQGNFVRIRAL
jgi:Leucine-rich repeat (LRR) protein